MNLEELKKKCLVFDIETCASYSDGTPINIRTDFEDYVKYAKVKWLGMYSYKFDEYNMINILETNPEVIKEYIENHEILVGFNNEEFDTPIMYNNDLMPENKRFLQVDCKVVLGDSTFLTHNGYPFKQRGKLMGYKFKNNSLKVMAQTMKLETQKGDIDYSIFFKNVWTNEETEEIKKYLKPDVKATKEMFDKLWDYWIPFTKFISEKFIKDLSWIRSSIASLRYKGDCKILDVEPTYADKPENKKKEKMGGKVIDVKYEEARNVIYLDFSSLYPWIRNMFAIDNEIIDMTEDKYNLLSDEEKNNIFHKNKLFETKGYYDLSYMSPLAIESIKNLEMRGKLKETDPNNPMIYTVKIYENSGYGVLRSPVFEKVHKPTGGWDICWLGQQFQKYTFERLEYFGFETIYGDTDSVFEIYNGDKNIDLATYIQECLGKILLEIMEYAPYPTDTFKIDIENYLEYVMWPFSEEPVKGEDGKNLKNEKGRLIKTRRGKKKNYVYLYEKDGEMKIKVSGLPIMKDNSTELGRLMLEKYIKPNAIERVNAKFSKKEIEDWLEYELEQDGAIKLLAREFKVKPDKTYKPNKDGTPSNNIYAQISRGYFNNQDGVISLIKNKKVGNAGKTLKYCTYEEAVEHNLTMDDLDLTKLKNELTAFERYEK